MPGLRFKLRTTCVSCGNPVPMTSASLDLACPSCAAPKRLAPGDLDWIVAAGPRSSLATSAKVTNGEGATVLGECESAPIACGGCGATIDDEALVGALSRGGLTCRCGRDVAVRRLPPELDGDGFWTAFVGETSEARAAPAGAPVQFACPSCGGALLVDGATRTPPCRFCSTRVYLPDDLWRALHPTPTAEPFYLWVDPAYYAYWTRRTDTGTRLGCFAAILVVVALAIAGSVIVVVGGVTDSDTGEPLGWWWGALMSTSVSWMFAWASFSLMGRLAGPKARVRQALADCGRSLLRILPGLSSFPSPVANRTIEPMSAVLCSQCSAPLPMEAVQGRAPCAFCGAVNAPPVNPYGPQAFAQAPVAVPFAAAGAEPIACPACRVVNPPDNRFCRGCGNSLPRAGAPQMLVQGAMAPVAPQVVDEAWGCAGCGRENKASYKFCLGCGAMRGEGGARFEGRAREGDLSTSRKRSPVVLVVVLATLLLAGAIAGVAAVFLAG